MADRQVTTTGKGSHGEITSLGFRGAPWSPRCKADVIRDIQQGSHSYHVIWENRERSEISVIHSLAGECLQTERRSSIGNGLVLLADC